MMFLIKLQIQKNSNKLQIQEEKDVKNTTIHFNVISILTLNGASLNKEGIIKKVFKLRHCVLLLDPGNEY